MIYRAIWARADFIYNPYDLWSLNLHGQGEDGNVLSLYLDGCKIRCLRILESTLLGDIISHCSVDPLGPSQNFKGKATVRAVVLLDNEFHRAPTVR